MKPAAVCSPAGVDPLTDETFPCFKCRRWKAGQSIEGMVFSSQKDLDLHLQAWPGNKHDHQRALQLAHDETELVQYRLHGGADRVVAQVADVVLRSGSEWLRARGLQDGVV